MLFDSLIFDEMAIQEHLEYDGSKFSGYIDLGENIACDYAILGNKVLVFMIVCINGGWKIPIAYYLIKGLSADEISNLVTECFKAVHETDMKIVSLTYDKTSTNFSVFKNLGCNFSDVTSLQILFPYSATNEKVVAFFDSYMLKLVNTFGNIQNLMEINNQYNDHT